MTKFRLHWQAAGKPDVSEIAAASVRDAERAFRADMLPGVRLLRIEPVEPDAIAPPVPSQPTDSPFSPLSAHRRLDQEDDSRTLAARLFAAASPAQLTIIPSRTNVILT